MTLSFVRGHIEPSPGSHLLKRNLHPLGDRTATAHGVLFIDQSAWPPPVLTRSVRTLSKHGAVADVLVHHLLIERSNQLVALAVHLSGCDLTLAEPFVTASQGL